MTKCNSLIQTAVYCTLISKNRHKTNSVIVSYINTDSSCTWS